MNPVIIFGLDGATFTVLDDLVRRGLMPALGQFMARGTRGVLKSTTLPLTPPAWSTLVTGRNPGGHGVVGFFQPESASSSHWRITTSRDLHCETIWSMVNRHGLRAGSLNFVLHAPPPRIDGYVIPGWMSWKWLKPFSHPRDLISRLSTTLPGFDLKALAMDFEEEHKCLSGEKMEDPGLWIRMHIERDRQWFGVLRHQMKHDPCALAGIVFDGVDKLQHLLWPYLDPALEPADPSPEFLRIRGLCWDYFRQIDGFLAETVEAVGKNGTVIVASDHGFSGSYETLYINSWLGERGYLAWSEKPPERTYVWDEYFKLTGFDLTRTTAFALTASSNGIYIQVRGNRDEYGIDPASYEAFRNELKDRLLNDCRDPETGEPIVRNVWTREEAFAGPYSGVAPDLTLGLRDSGFISLMRSSGGFVRKREQPVGMHHPDGVFVACGAGVRRGARIDPVHLADIAPTVLHRLGLPVPQDLDGRVIDDMFTRTWNAAHPASIGGATVAANGLAKAAAADSTELESDTSARDAELVDKLKMLGYME